MPKKHKLFNKLGELFNIIIKKYFFIALNVFGM